ncbi:MAG: hypothetical protein ACFFCW_01950 [Candidatus Hodarchaeota archaeon]
MCGRAPALHEDELEDAKYYRGFVENVHGDNSIPVNAVNIEKVEIHLPLNIDVPAIEKFDTILSKILEIMNSKAQIKQITTITSE